MDKTTIEAIRNLQASVEVLQYVTAHLLAAMYRGDANKTRLAGMRSTLEADIGRTAMSPLLPAGQAEEEIADARARMLVRVGDLFLQADRVQKRWDRGG